jgi:hypothetical protein
LARALLVVKLITERLLLGTVVAIKRVLAELLLDSDVDLVKKTLIHALLVVPKFLLVPSLIAIFRDYMAVEGKVEYQVLNNVISLVVAVLVRELGCVVGSLRVIRVESLNDVGLTLLGS